MLLSCTFLTQVADVNNFQESLKVYMTEGDTVDVYLMLRDMVVNPATSGYNPPGRRYMPAAGATLQVTIPSVNEAKNIVKFASQPFPLDPSIWKFTIQASDRIVGSLPLKLALNEGGKITNGLLHTAIYVNSLASQA